MSLTKLLLKKSWEETLAIINDKWEYVDAVAKELMKNETVSSERFEEIVNNIANSHTINGENNDL